MKNTKGQPRPIRGGGLHVCRYTGRTIPWADVATPKRRRAVAERVGILARTDWQNRDTLVRVVSR